MPARLLRGLGFAGGGQSLVRSAGPVEHWVAFRSFAGLFDGKVAGYLVCELSVVSPSLAKRFEFFPEGDRSALGQIRTDLGKVSSPMLPVRWPLRTQEEAEETGARIADALVKHGLPFLDRFEAEEDVFAAIREGRHLALYPPIAKWQVDVLEGKIDPATTPRPKPPPGGVFNSVEEFAKSDVGAILLKLSQGAKPDDEPA